MAWRLPLAGRDSAAGLLCESRPASRGIGLAAPVSLPGLTAAALPRHPRPAPRGSPGTPCEPRLAVRAAAEPTPNAALRWLDRAQAALPVVGLLSRLARREGGVGTEKLYYAEYCVRQERAISPAVAAALREFQARYGQMARPGVVLFWCWLATVGAGVAKREDIIKSARRMRASLDMELELNMYTELLDDPTKREAAAKVAASVPQAAKARMAADAIVECCIGPSAAPDYELLEDFLPTFFPGITPQDLGLRSEKDTDSVTVEKE